MHKVRIAALAFTVTAGCAGQAKYACGVPGGVGCRSVGAVYEASVAGQLPAAQTTEDDAQEADPSPTEPAQAAAEPAAVVTTVEPGAPLLTRPRHIRVWVRRWEDRSGDLHDETFLYLRLDNGAWRLSP